MEKTNKIITISRQKGSGGHEIGKRLAEQLGIPFYDKEIIERAAKESGIDELFFKKQDAKPTRSLLYSLAMGAMPMGFSQTDGDNIPFDQKVFLAQMEAVQKIAKEGPCVIVGRCADYALEGDPRLLSVYIYGDEKDRINRVVEREEISEEKSLNYIRRCDKRRENFYEYYSTKHWGSTGSYDVCINSSKFGMDGCLKLLMEAVHTI